MLIEKAPKTEDVEAGVGYPPQRRNPELERDRYVDHECVPPSGEAPELEVVTVRVEILPPRRR